MSLAMSFFMLVINLGFVDNFLYIWAGAFVVAFAVAMPTAFVAFQIAKKILSKIVME